MLYNQHHCLISRTFPSSQKEAMYPSAVSPNSSFPLAPGNHSSVFYPYGFASSGHFIWMESYNIWPFVSGFFHLYFKFIHVTVCINISFLFCGWIVSYCMDIPYFAYPLTGRWTFGLSSLFFFFLVIKTNIAINIHVQVFVWTCVLISLGHIPRSRIAGL